MKNKLKVQYMSDLHLEFGDMQVPDVAGDVLVLAGDIGVGDSAVKWINKCALVFKDVIYICGNHEFYHQDMPKLLYDFRVNTVWEPNVHFLNNNTITIKGVKFAASTLWADMTNNAFFSMNDSRIINYAGERMSFFKVKALHQESMMFLQDNIDADVFITHHCPSIKSINQNRYPDDTINSGYYTNILNKFADCNVKHWICGHTHSALKYKEKGITVYNNCRGYINRSTGKCEVKDFNPNAIFEVEIQDKIPLW